MKGNWITFESASPTDRGSRILVKADNICEVDEMTKHKTRVFVHGGTWIIVKGDFDSVIKRIADAVVDVYPKGGV